MTRWPAQLAGLFLCGLYLQPGIVIEKLRVPFVEIELSGLTISAKFIAAVLCIVVVALGFSYAADWNELGEGMGDHSRGGLDTTFGWPVNRADGPAAARIISRHRIKLATFILFDAFASAAIILVLLLILWHFVYPGG